MVCVRMSAGKRKRSIVHARRADSFEGGLGGGDRLFNARVVVSRAEEPRFELAGRQRDTLFEHAGEEGGKGARVAGSRLFVVLDGTFGEEDGEHRADAV